jgi:nitroimidazol reductase NimA-like FMN-containing flavoprotein (pyridoxamine 5'-phosphate oxidase superfamily)
MRQEKYELNNPLVIERILQNQQVGRLATVDSEGYPYIVPVNYVWYQGAIYFHSAPAGEKLENLQRDKRVGFCVDIPLAYLDTGFDPQAPPCMVTQFYQSIVIRGRAEIVTEMEEKLRALNALMASHEQGDSAAIEASMPAVALCVVVAIRVESLTAKANLAQKKTQSKREQILSYLKKRNIPGDLHTVETISQNQ